MASTFFELLKRRGLPDPQVDELADLIERARAERQPERAWRHVSQRVLTPADPFELHEAAFAACYGEGALQTGAAPAWMPTQDVVEHANVTGLARELGLPDYAALHAWSIEHREAYWSRVLRRLNVQFDRPCEAVLDAPEGKPPRWLRGARLNIVASCFQADPTTVAVIESDGARLRTCSYGELKSRAARVAHALSQRGIVAGDAVAMILPMGIDAVAGYLGVLAAGAAVVSVPESFSSDEIGTRLRIADVKLVITQDVVPRGGKRLPLYDKVRAACDAPAVVVPADQPFTPADARDVSWAQFQAADAPFAPVSRDPGDPINILFSSGTTGEPKAIPWDHTTAVKAAADAHFHHDVHPGDVLCWPTSLGWMMGPWLIFASLLNRATMALYTQAPGDRAFGAFVRDAKVTMLGSVPSMVRAWRQGDCMRGLDWSGIRAFSSSGECSNATEMLYLMHLAGYRPVIEYCGGTEIGGGYITGTVVQPSVPAAFSTPALGIDLAILDEAHAPATAGEAFLIGPSMGLSWRLLNREHDAVYYADAPVLDGVRLRRHGDEIRRLPNGYWRVVGRCDDTMNLGGIKVGCVEIERVLNQVDGVLETAAVAENPPGGGPSRLVVFAVPKTGTAITGDELLPAMRQAIRARLNPLFHLDRVEVVASLPRTASNKVMRRELRASLNPR
jgi:acetyl-CoA synthetase